jgi:hypothetical protein
VHAKKIGSNPAERRKGRWGKVAAKGRRGPSYAARPAPTNNILTPLQAICLAERCALLSGHVIDFVMNVFAAWTGTRWGELMAVEGSATGCRRRGQQGAAQGRVLQGAGHPALLAELLGLPETTAARWTRQAAGDWTRYAAELTRTPPHQH